MVFSGAGGRWPGFGTGRAAVVVRCQLANDLQVTAPYRSPGCGANVRIVLATRPTTTTTTSAWQCPLGNACLDPPNGTVGGGPDGGPDGALREHQPSLPARPTAARGTALPTCACLVWILRAYRVSALASLGPPPPTLRTTLRTRQKFQGSQLTELATSDFEAWAKRALRDCDEDCLSQRRADRDSQGRQCGLHDGSSGSRASCGICC